MSVALTTKSPSSVSEKAPKSQTSRLEILAQGLGVAALAILLGAWWLLDWFGDRSAIPTLLLFGPKWLLLAPVALATIAALAFRRRSLVWTVYSLAVYGFAIEAGNVPWRSWIAARPDSSALRVRVLSCNIGVVGMRPADLKRWIEGEQAEIVALQEVNASVEPTWVNDVFPKTEGWRTVATGEGLIAARHPIHHPRTLSDPETFGYKGAVSICEVALPGATIAVVNLHLRSQRDGLEGAIASKLRDLSAMRETIARRDRGSAIARNWIGDPPAPLLILGDFNLPAQSAIYRRDWGRFADAFERSGWGAGRTWFSRWHGLRIDHILGGPGWTFESCRVGPNVGSDHRPVAATAILAPPKV